MAQTKEQLEKLLELSTKLGIWDDVIHWKSELRKLEQETA